MTGMAWLIVALVATAGGSLLSTIHQALRDARRVALEELAASRGKEFAARLRHVLDDPEGHAVAIAFPRIICNLIVVVGAVLWIASLREQVAPGPLEQALGILASALLLWVFGVVLPHVLAKHAGERIILRWLWLVRLAHSLARPAIALVDMLDREAGRRLGRDEGEQLEDELLSVVEEGKLAGQLDEADQAMIESVVDMRDRTVEEIMTPRPDVVALSVRSNLGDVVAFLREHSRSRYPVFDGDLDHVVGIFYVKDLLQWLTSDRPRPGFDLRSILRPPVIVPETKTVRELLDEFRAKRLHIAVVANEYGSTSGIVTMEDIIEEVFGDIADEHEAVEPSAQPQVNIDEGWATLDARLRIGDANGALRALGVELPEDEGYDTVAGFVASRLGRMPKPGEAFQEGRLRVTVVEALPTRIESVRVQAEPAAPA